MKKYRINIVLLALSLIFTQCYKDNSNTEIKVINQIVVDNSIQDQKITVSQLDTIHVLPMVYKVGTDDAKLEYSWVLSGLGIIPTTLGTDMTLHAPVAAPPTTEPYTLTLTVTDTETSLQSFAMYYVYVTSQFRMGLVVADTRDNGLTSDISLIRSENFSAYLNARDNRVFRDVFSQVNGHKVEGKVKGMFASAYYNGNNRFLTIFTDNSISRVDPYDFAVRDRDNDLFYIKLNEEDIKPKQISYINTYSESNCMNVNGKTHIHRLGMAPKYNFAMSTKDKTDYKAGKMSAYGGSYEFPYIFDELNNRVLQIDNDYATIMVFDDKYAGSVFDINRIGKYDALYMGYGQDGNKKTVRMVLKAEDAQKYYCYVFQINEPSVGPTPLYIYDLNGCEGINEAVAFECNPLENVFYYATPKGIYSTAMFSGQPLSAKKCYTPKDGEEVTNLKLWRARGFMQGNVRISDSNEASGYKTISAINRMLVVSTYNKGTKEGKIIALPLPNLGSGEIEPNTKYQIEYDGFGEIIDFDDQSV